MQDVSAFKCINFCIAKEKIYTTLNEKDMKEKGLKYDKKENLWYLLTRDAAVW